MDRRSFLRSTLAGAGALAFGDAFWRAALAGPAVDAPSSSYGALGPADLNGLQYPAGFTGRVIAQSGTPTGLTSHLWPAFPDGAACFPRPPAQGPGWILVVNSENPPAADVGLLPEVQDLLGGASGIVDAYWVLKNTRSNRAGGTTPWGTWLSCEEFDFTVRTPGAKPSQAGRVFECDPTDKGGLRSRELPRLGRFKHEAAAFDSKGRVYLTEDMADGCLYRFTPADSPNAPASLTAGTLEALRITSGTSGPVTWVGPIDPTAAVAATRVQASGFGATQFNGGEGCYHHDGTVLFTTKGDDRVWALTLGEGIASDTIEVLYDGRVPAGERVLTGVDNIIVSPETGNIYVAEDGEHLRRRRRREHGGGRDRDGSRLHSLRRRSDPGDRPPARPGELLADPHRVGDHRPGAQPGLHPPLLQRPAKLRPRHHLRGEGAVRQDVLNTRPGPPCSRRGRR